MLSIENLKAAQLTNPNIVEYSLDLQTSKSEWQFPLLKNNVKLEQAGISWYEPFSHSFYGGLEVGYTELSQADNPMPSAQFTSGEYIGLLFRYAAVQQSALSLNLHIKYRYNRTEGKSTLQNSQFAWHETTFSSELVFHSSKNLNLILAADYLQMGGEQRDSGNITQLTTFKNVQEKASYRAGIEFIPYRTGVIGIEWSSGIRDATKLYFKRKF